MCIEQLKEGHDQLLNTDVTIAVLLDVVAHGLPLRFGQQMSGLFLQHGPTLVHQTGQSHLRSRHTFIKATLRRIEKKKKRKYFKRIHAILIFKHLWLIESQSTHLKSSNITG